MLGLFIEGGYKKNLKGTSKCEKKPKEITATVGGESPPKGKISRKVLPGGNSGGLKKQTDRPKKDSFP